MCESVLVPTRKKQEGRGCGKQGPHGLAVRLDAEQISQVWSMVLSFVLPRNGTEGGVAGQHITSSGRGDGSEKNKERTKKVEAITKTGTSPDDQDGQHRTKKETHLFLGGFLLCRGVLPFLGLLSVRYGTVQTTKELRQMMHEKEYRK